MGKSSTSFGKDRQPQKRRTKSFRTKILDVIRNESLIGANRDTTKEEAEALYLSHFARRAFDVDDPASATLSRELLNKSYPSLKSSLPPVNFKLPEDATPIEKAEAILQAVSVGDIPPDVGTMLIQAAKYTIDIESATELKDRLAAIEKELGIV